MSGSTSGFRVAGLFHVTNVVRDLKGMRDFHSRLFGVETVTSPYALGRYATLCLVGDVLIDSTCPAHDVYSPRRVFAELVGDHWSPVALWIEDMQDCIFQLHEMRRLTLTAYSDGMPIVGSPVGVGGMSIAFTAADETGVQWGLYEADIEVTRSDLFQRLDPRASESWRPAPPAEHSVGQQVHSHHTIVVDDNGPTVAFLVDILGGEIFFEGENVALGAKSTYVSIGTRPITVEIAVPYSDGPAQRDQARNGNIYHALNFKVDDLDRAVKHLGGIGVGIETRTEELVITDPKDCHGLRYGFTAALPPLDPRRPGGVHTG